MNKTKKVKNNIDNLEIEMDQIEHLYQKILGMINKLHEGGRFAII